MPEKRLVHKWALAWSDQVPANNKWQCSVCPAAMASQRPRKQRWQETRAGDDAY